MTRDRLLLLLLLSCLLAWCGVASAQTGDAGNGHTTYTTWCVGCHNANPKIDAHGVLNGAGNPNFILNEWNTVPQMQFLVQGALPDPVQAAADVAAYLATFIGGGGGQGNLQVPSTVGLGTQAVGTQSGATVVTITNVGGASVTVSSVGDANGAEFPLVSQSCTTGPVPTGGSCQLSIAFRPAASGARSSAFTVTSNATGSPQTLLASGIGTTAGPAPGQLQIPPWVDFGNQNIGSQSTPSTMTLTNSGGTAVAINSIISSDPAEFPITSLSCAGTLPPRASCALSVAFNPATSGQRVATISVTSTGLGSPQTIAVSGTGALAIGGGPTVQAVEYYYAAWDFYFETAFPTEIAALDGGAFGGVWQRTGQTFNVWPQSNPAASPTCRFFSTAFAPKSSHFYTPFAAECATLMTNTSWQYEAIAFYIQLADANGLCAAGTVPLYRLYNNGMGGAPNHRYTTDLSIFNQMLAAGWLFEGNGNTKVFACVPQ